MPHKLLVADDSATIRRVIELMFADDDIEVVAVSDGAQAIEAFAREVPDIVLADASMPEKDGYEVAAFVKGDPAHADIPVVLLTGAFEPVDERQAETVGCAGVLVKPFEPQQVIGTVKALLAAADGATGADATRPTPADPPAGVESGPDPEQVVADPRPVEMSEGSSPVAPAPSRAAAPDAGHTAGSVLAQAFATFLAVEQGAPAPSLPPVASPAEAPAPPALSEATLDALVDRVASRVTDSIVREMTADVVSQVAERLIRAEADRIKAGAE